MAKSPATSVITAKVGHQTFHSLVTEMNMGIMGMESNTKLMAALCEFSLGRIFPCEFLESKCKQRVWKWWEWLSGWEELTEQMEPHLNGEFSQGILNFSAFYCKIIIVVNGQMFFSF